MAKSKKQSIEDKIFKAVVNRMISPDADTEEVRELWCITEYMELKSSKLDKLKAEINKIEQDLEYLNVRASYLEKTISADCIVDEIGNLVLKA